jgi:hypothetical protein
MVRPFETAAAFIALAGLAACATPLSSGARDTFARMTKCASDPVSVVPHPDSGLHASQPSPPDDSSDPGKLAYWQERRSAQVSRPPAPDADCEMFEVTGCGQHLLLCCRHPLARDSTGVLMARTDAVECEAR